MLKWSDFDQLMLKQSELLNLGNDLTVKEYED